MSCELFSSESTVYLSNIPFHLTNNDLHQILGNFGQIARITILKDKVSRISKGVAFILFVERESAIKCVHELNNSLLNGRTVKCSIAKDNGRSREFVKRRDYLDKSRCFECGEEGHLSYTCPRNSLGNRKVVKKKTIQREKHAQKRRKYQLSDESNDEFDKESLSFAIRFQKQNNDEDSKKTEEMLSSPERKRLKIKKSSYFSDEEEESYE